MQERSRVKIRNNAQINATFAGAVAFPVCLETRITARRSVLAERVGLVEGGDAEHTTCLPPLRGWAAPNRTLATSTSYSDTMPLYTIGPR